MPPAIGPYATETGGASETRPTRKKGRVGRLCKGGSQRGRNHGSARTVSTWQVQVKSIRCGRNGSKQKKPRQRRASVARLMHGNVNVHLNPTSRTPEIVGENFALSRPRTAPKENRPRRQRTLPARLPLGRIPTAPSRGRGRNHQTRQSKPDRRRPVSRAPFQTSESSCP